MIDIQPIQQQAESWRTEAEQLRGRGLHQAGDLLESCARDLDACLREWWYEPLTPREAAREAPWKVDTIARRIGNELPQAGEPYHPRVRRCDLHAAISGDHDAEDAPEGPDVAGAVLREMV